MNQKTSDAEYSPTESARRLEAIMRGAFSGSPKPMKDIPRKRPKTKRKPRKKAETSV